MNEWHDVNLLTSLASAGGHLGAAIMALDAAAMERLTEREAAELKRLAAEVFAVKASITQRRNEVGDRLAGAGL